LWQINNNRLYFEIIDTVHGKGGLMGEILIVTDLGHFKAYEVIEEPMESSRLELIKEFQNIEAHKRMGEKLSDEPGRFGREQGGGQIIKGFGEDHNLQAETEKKLIKAIAREIDKIIKKYSCTKWHLAAEKTINNRILEGIDKDVYGYLDKNIKADLTKKGKKELLSYIDKNN